MFGSRDLEDGLGPSKQPPPPPYSESSQTAQPSIVDSPPCTHQQRRTGEGWIWFRTLASLVFFSVTVGNVIQHAAIIRSTGLIIILAITSVCWLMYFPRTLWSTHTGIEVKGYVLLAEILVVLILMIPCLIALLISVVEFHRWQSNGTAGTRYAVSTEGSSLKASIALCSYTIVHSLVWFGALLKLYYRNLANGGKLRWTMSVPSLIRETRAPAHV